MLESARARLAQPALLLLNEPAAGLNQTEAVNLSGLIRRIREQGTTIVLVEHHMDVVMTVCDTVTVLNYGRKLAPGTPAGVEHCHGVAPRHHHLHVVLDEDDGGARSEEHTSELQ